MPRYIQINQIGSKQMLQKMNFDCAPHISRFLRMIIDLTYYTNLTGKLKVSKHTFSLLASQPRQNQNMLVWEWVPDCIYLDPVAPFFIIHGQGAQFEYF